MPTQELDDGERLAVLEVQFRALTEDLLHVDERATRAERFLKRALTGAVGGIGGALLAAALLVYSAGEKAERRLAEQEETKAELMHRIELVDDGLTELRKSVRLLLEADLPRR